MEQRGENVNKKTTAQQLVCIPGPDGKPHYYQPIPLQPIPYQQIQNQNPTHFVPLQPQQINSKNNNQIPIKPTPQQVPSFHPIQPLKVIGQIPLQNKGVKVNIKPVEPSIKTLNLLSKPETYSDAITFFVNGKKHTLSNFDPRTTLNEFLRSQYGLTGTKKSCGEGGCGACTVVLSWFDNNLQKNFDVSVNSCLAPLCSIDGKQVTTIEGIGNAKEGYSTIQEQLAASNGSQCGFCSPGMVMNMYSLLLNDPSPSEKTVEDHFDGNLCRCTGYRPILNAFKTFASDYDPSHSPCKSKGKFNDIEDICKGFCQKKCKPSSNSQSNSSLSTSKIQKEERQWYNPISLSAVYSLIQNYQNYVRKLVVGNTSTGIFKETADADIFINLRNVAELNFTSISSTGVSIGAAITISNLIDTLDQYNTQYNSVYNTSSFPNIIKFLFRVANFQVRNAASWGGNVMLAHNHQNFPSDIITLLMGIGATLTIGDALTGLSSTYDIPSFLTLNMLTKVIISLTIPFTSSGQTINGYKVSLRHENSHSYVNAVMNISVNASQIVTGNPIIAYGGVASFAQRAAQTELYLIGKSLTDINTLNTACNILMSEMVVNPEPGNIDYRSSLITSFFYKHYLSLLLPNIPSNIVSAATQYDRPVSKGTYSYSDDPIEYPVSEYIPKVDGILQTSGEATYTDDLLPSNGSLFASFVMSENGSAEIESIDAKEALLMPGVVDFVSAKDVPGQNTCNTTAGIPSEYNEEIFATSNVLYYGQSIGLIIADTQRHADDAAKHVKITYKNSQTPILTIPDAISKNSFFPNANPALTVEVVQSGNVQDGFASSSSVYEGEIFAPSQYHFHMETHSCLVHPEEGGKYSILISTQWPAIVQQTVATALGISSNNITVSTKRVGGGYGGKITRSAIVACAASVAARKLGRPIRLIMSLNSNMQLQGKRHEFLCVYKVGVNSSNKLQALQLEYYANGGSTYDGSVTTINMALTTADNVYYIPNFYATGKACRTNLPANTYMRAPGCLPAIYFIEQIMERLSHELNVDPDTLRQLNFYSQGQTTPYGTPLPYWNLPTIWSDIQVNSFYSARKEEVNEYNQSNRWTKKGISLIPMKYGIEWFPSFFGATIDIFNDGTIQCFHSGIEVGQGINTKVAQVLSYQLQCDMKDIHVTATSTQLIPNGSSTGGSITSELCSKAVIGAADLINDRLKLFRDEMKDATWKEIIAAAADAGTNLQASYWNKGAPTAENGPFQYNSQGAAIAEIQLDVLTGSVQILQVDILYDCGTSLNPAIDIGQVEGGFVQGIGLYLTELLQFNSDGKLTTNGTWEYKPPSSKDIPINFNVALLPNAPNPRGVLSSKASGEPPMTLACSAFFAVKHAIDAARSDAQAPFLPHINPPATVFVNQQSCAVSPSQFTI